MKALFLILFLAPLQLFAQDITGIWTGYLKTTDNTLPFELAISSEGKDNFGGYSHTVFTFNGIDNIGVKTIKVKNKKGNVSLEDGDLVYSNYTTPPRRVKLFGNLYLKTSDSLMVLSGTFFTRTIDFRESARNSFVGTVYLRKQKGFPKTKLISMLDEMEMLYTLSFAPEQYQKKEEPAIAAISTTPHDTKQIASKEISKPLEQNSKTAILSTDNKEKKKDKEKENEIAANTVEKGDEKPGENLPSAIITPPQINAAIALTQRKTEIIRNVFFSSDSLVLSLYDNGTVDGDTVTVVLNGDVILAKKRLTENAIRTTLHIPRGHGDSLQLVMYAENLGSIPPNTGVLVIQDGLHRNEIRFSGDMQKSSGVILKRRR